jgi:hypothetical protein
VRVALLLVLVAGCDPAWGVPDAERSCVTVRANYPNAVPVDDATLAVACGDGQYAGMAVKTRRDGSAQISAIGGMWPVGCDIYLAKPGFRTHRIRYQDLCPQGPEGCDRVFAFDLVLEPAQQ